MNSKSDSYLYGSESDVFYIYAPRWIDSSAGIRVLHYLCHALNSVGKDAYLAISDFTSKSNPRINGRLKTPILTNEIARAHVMSNRRAITIYPETVKGNPLGSPRVIRYLLNYAGVLGGEESFPKSELVVAFSKNIATKYQEINGNECLPVLFLPPVNPFEFKYNTDKKDFQLVYGGKYRTFVGPLPVVGELKSIEIYRDGTKMQSRDEVIRLLSEAKIMYVFENTSLITEAVLSGTPVIGVRSTFFSEIIAERETGMGGVRFIDSTDAINEAESSLQEGVNQYLEQIDGFEYSLNEFIEISDQFFLDNSKPHIIDLGNDRLLFLSHKIALSIQIIRNKGMTTFLRMLYFYVRRKIGLRRIK